MEACKIKNETELAKRTLSLIIKRNMTQTPEDMIRSIYEFSYSGFVNNGFSSQAMSAALQVTRGAVSILHNEFIAEESQVRTVIQELIGKDKFSEENINKYSNLEDIKNLLGLRTEFPSRVESNISPKEVEGSLDKIQKGFPKVGRSVKFKHNSYNKTMDFTVIDTPEGPIKLSRVTSYSNSKLDSKNSNTIETRIGTITDFVIRELLNSKDSYEDTVKRLMKDEKFLTKFAAVTENRNENEIQGSIKDILFLKYAESFLIDSVYGINYILDTYKDYHITDLSELITRSSLSNEEKEKFYVYSKELKLRGEVDIIALSPDGKFKVIDLKTTQKNNIESRETSENYIKQASAYDLLIQKATGLISEGSHDILYFIMNVHNKNVTTGQEGGIFKISIVDFNKKTNKNINPIILADDIKKYTEKSDLAYSEEIKVTQAEIAPPVKFRSAFSRNKGKYHMVFSNTEELSTSEDLQRGKEWLKSVFPEMSDDQIRIISSGKGGECLLDAIHLYKQSNIGVAYHEGFHRFSQLFLTKQEKLDMYSDIRKSNISFQTRDGRSLNSSSASNLDIEEFLAEEFKNYAMNRESYVFPEGNPKIKNIFQRIWDAIKQLFEFYTEHGTFSYQTMFENLYTGNFNRTNFDINNSIWSNLNSIFIEGENGNELLSNVTFRKYRDLIDFEISIYLRTQDILISQLVSKNDLKNISNIALAVLQDHKLQHEELFDEIINSSSEEQLRRKQEVLQVTNALDEFDKILLEKDGEFVNFPSFMKAFYKTSSFDTLKKIYKDAKGNRFIDEEAIIALDSQTIEEDSKADDDFKNEMDLKYGKPGNEDAIENARAMLKDFFNGVQKIASSKIIMGKQLELVDDNGLPVLVKKKNAFYKTLQILNGSMTLEEMARRLESVDAVSQFPEIIEIKNRLLGGTSQDGIVNKGLIPKAMEIAFEIHSGNNTRLQEAKQLLSFLMHFNHVMSMTIVDFKNLIIKTNYDIGEQVNVVSPVMSRMCLDQVTSNILTDFTKGFGINANKEFTNKSTYINVYDLIHKLLTTNDMTSTISTLRSEKFKFIYDPINKKFFFNLLYAIDLANNVNASMSEDTDKYRNVIVPLKKFFSYIGLNIDSQAFENHSDLTQMIKSFKTLKILLDTSSSKFADRLADKIDNPILKGYLDKWKTAKEELDTLGPTDLVRLIKEDDIADIQKAIRPYIYELFSSDPINDFLFDGKDKKLRYDPRYKVFAAFRSTFESIANIQKKYHGYFSSTSVLVKDGLQWSSFLNNGMLITTNTINMCSSFLDFSNYRHLSHLDPIKNPQIKNSWILSKVFNIDGKRIESKKGMAKIGLQVMAQSTFINHLSEVEELTPAELTTDKKLLHDILSIRAFGVSTMRQFETSDTNWVLSAMDTEGNYIKPVNFTSNAQNFHYAPFIKLIHRYIQHAAHKYKFYLNEDNRNKVDAKYNTNLEELKKGMSSLGVFDEMLGEHTSEIKEVIKTYEGDLNELFDYILVTNEALFDNINSAIGNYFEDITIRNEDSFKNSVDDILSDTSKSILNKISNINSTNKIIDIESDGKLKDYILRDVIANDFIMAMEDAMLFFGDYTYYLSPAKRRKVSSNNGSIHMVEGVIKDLYTAISNTDSLASLYQNAMGIESKKDYSLVDKVVIKDVSAQSKYAIGDKGSSKIVSDLMKLRKTHFPGLDSSMEGVEEAKKGTLDSFRDLKFADGGAIISMDTAMFMLSRDMRVTPELENEYFRQKLIMKRNLKIPLTDEEINIINTPTGASFNIMKLAMTGPIYDTEPGDFRNVFDKMGLRVLLPETDWDSTMRPVFEYMLSNNIDYAVFDSASKGYMPTINPAFSMDGRMSTFDKNNVKSFQHAGAWFKTQLNTFDNHDSSTFASQLRGIFFEMIAFKEKYGFESPNLKAAYTKFIASMTELILVNSSRALSQMGLDHEGNIINRSLFITYLKNRLIDVDKLPEDLLDQLNVNKNGTFTTYLEALPFHRDLANIISGVIDDNFRKIKLNGSKLYQTHEMGTTKLKNGLKTLSADQRGTIELKWHELEFDKNGRAISTLPVEAKINFSKQWEPLLNTLHPDGKLIKDADPGDVLRRLNEAINDEEWLKKHKNSIIFIGVRIPLQDINFSSHMIIKEFLPSAVGDTIILPPEFYAQTGSDNDIDTVTTTYRYLNDKGKVITRPSTTINGVTVPDKYVDIIKRINEVSNKIQEEKFKQVTPESDIQEYIEQAKQDILDANLIKDLSPDEVLGLLDEEFKVVEGEGYKTFAGLVHKKGFLRNAQEKGTMPLIMDDIDIIHDMMNESNKSNITDTLYEELNQLKKKKSIFKKALTNELINNIVEFMSAPENYELLTESDNITKIKELAAKILSMKSATMIEAKDLAKNRRPLVDISYLQNLINHYNNSHMRPILGSIVKFRKVLTTLSQIGLILNTDYTAGNMAELQKGLLDAAEELARKINYGKTKTYERKMFTPLLYNKDISNGIKVSIFDEDGNRMTKSLSELVSTLLDLFTSQDVFPSLGLSWLNIKTMVVLAAQGVPLNRAILFLNNPIIQSISDSYNKLGTGVRDKHAVIKVAQELFGSDIFKQGSPDEAMKDETIFSLYSDMEKTDINQYMRRIGKSANKYLTENAPNVKFTEDETERFTVEYGKYINSGINKNLKNLKSFLNKYPEFIDLAKNTTAYYATLLEDGDLFYKFFVKAMDRDSTKHNNISSIAHSEAIERARITSGMANPAFENNLKTNSIYAPFYQDKIVKNVIKNTLPNLLNNPNKDFSTQFIKMIEKVTSNVLGTSEARDLVEKTLIGDFMDNIVKNFYFISQPLYEKIIKDGKEIEVPVFDLQGKQVIHGNNIYDWFEFEITPSMRMLMGQTESFNEFLKTFNKDVLNKVESDPDEVLALTYNDGLLTTQLELFKMKYPELIDHFTVLDEFLWKREAAMDTSYVKPSNFRVKDMYNGLQQNYIYLNSASDPNVRVINDEQFRDDWEKMFNFDIRNVPGLYSDLVLRDRVSFYRDEKNVSEIQRFAKTLALYMLSQSSHMNIRRNTSSHLIPKVILKEVIETAINNFNEYLSGESNISAMLEDFENTFIDMHGEINWLWKPTVSSEIVENPEDGTYSTLRYKYVPYKKAYTGNLYGKTYEKTVENWKFKKFASMGLSLWRNDFMIDNRNDDNPLNCKLP